MNLLPREMLLIAVVLTAAIAAIFAVGFTGSTSPEPPETPPQATSIEQASKPVRGDRALAAPKLARIHNAALATAGPGILTEVDRSDDLGEAYEVEVVTQRGEIDVALDRNFEPVPNLRYAE